eukprot:g3399.t1
MPSSSEKGEGDKIPPLPKGWSEKESRSRPGKFYYVNRLTGETSWKFPTAPATRKRSNNDNSESSEKRRKKSSVVKSAFSCVSDEKVHCFHILAKHAGSRNPKSRLQPDGISRTKEEAIEKIKLFRADLLKEKELKGDEGLRLLFEKLGRQESDCGSGKRGGDLGSFGRGRMQKPFEEASFALKIGELSDIVDSASGIHVILRVA